MIGYIFCHGWGLDPTFFSLLRPYFDHHPTLFWDLGYFGDVHCPLPNDKAETWVGVGHSFGFAKVLQAAIPVKGWVGLQAFVNFLGTEEKARAKRDIDLKAFEKKFKASPHEMLVRIQQACGMEPVRATPHLERLTSDLSALRTDYSCLLSSSIPTLLIGSADDPVVPPDLIRDNFQAYHQVRFLSHEKGGHRLCPASAPLAAQQILDFARGL